MNWALRRRYGITGSALALLCAVYGLARLTDASAHASLRPGGEKPLAAGQGDASINTQFKLITVGDLIYWQPVAKSPDLKLQEVLALLRSGDLAVGNLEGMSFDFKNFSGHEYGSALLWKEPTVPGDLRSIGIGAVSLANNHTMDWGWSGLKDTMRLLDRAGIVYAGAGPNLQAATAPAFVRTKKGLVALISATSTTNAPDESASDPYRGMPSRSGADVLRWRAVHLLTADQFKMLRRLATAQASEFEPAPSREAREITFDGQQYRLSDHPGLRYEMNQFDLRAILQAVKTARKSAQIVIFTIHAHETATGEDDGNPQPPDFLVALAHRVIDAGADVFLAGGPHALRGIEVYKGHPIFYGIGSLFLQGKIVWGQQEAFDNDFPGTPRGQWGPPWTWEQKPQTCDRVEPQGDPQSWLDGLVAVTGFEKGRPRTVTLYPLNLGRGSCDPARRGIPHLAASPDARRILGYLQRDSAEFGTEIAIRGSIGIIRIP